MPIKIPEVPVRPIYESQYGSQLDDLANQYAGRKFNFDVNKDALWKQLTQQYQQGGQLAMQNTVGQVTAQTGGYGNSYAQTAGQQQFQNYMTGLYDMLPQVQNMARQNYDAETSRIMNMYNMASDKENRDYSRYQDQLAQYNRDQSRYDQALGDDQKAADTMLAYYVNNGMTPPEELYARSSYDREYWEAILKNWKKKGSGGSGGKNGTDISDVNGLFQNPGVLSALNNYLNGNGGSGGGNQNAYNRLYQAAGGMPPDDMRSMLNDAVNAGYISSGQAQAIIKERTNGR